MKPTIESLVTLFVHTAKCETGGGVKYWETLVAPMKGNGEPDYGAGETLWLAPGRTLFTEVRRKHDALVQAACKHVATASRIVLDEANEARLAEAYERGRRDERQAVIDTLFKNR